MFVSVCILTLDDVYFKDGDILQTKSCFNGLGDNEVFTDSGYCPCFPPLLMWYTKWIGQHLLQLTLLNVLIGATKSKHLFTRYNVLSFF